ncbi:MAG TPA: Fic family protein [Candidatus Nanoarchaeia archaeon]|nr:Fic family protein [Candidatus Nanoarchaeia archaeon]
MQPEEFQGSFGELREREDKCGKYVTFVPQVLPPKIELTPEIVLALSKADAKLGKLSGVGLLLPNPNLLILPYLKKEAIMSSRIEGTRISLSELFLTEAKGNEENVPDALEVTNYVKAVSYGLEKIEKEPITIELIKEMHNILMRGVRGDNKYPGEFRTIQNWIGPPNSKPQEAQFVPPPPEEVLRLLQELISYLNTDDRLPLLMKCSLMHYQFETIHPFCDGNGRIGRSLITLYLCKKKLIMRPLLYLSGYFEKYRREYINLLLSTNKEGKFENWIRFFLDAVAIQSEDALQRVTKMQKLREEYRKKTQESYNTTAITKLIDHLFMNPFITITTAEKVLGVTYPTAKRLVENLMKQGILKQSDEKVQRNKIFVAHEILSIIEV